MIGSYIVLGYPNFVIWLQRCQKQISLAYIPLLLFRACYCASSGGDGIKQGISYKEFLGVRLSNLYTYYCVNDEVHGVIKHLATFQVFFGYEL